MLLGGGSADDRPPHTPPQGGFDVGPCQSLDEQLHPDIKANSGPRTGPFPAPRPPRGKALVDESAVPVTRSRFGEGEPALRRLAWALDQEPHVVKGGTGEEV